MLYDLNNADVEKVICNKMLYVAYCSWKSVRPHPLIKKFEIAAYVNVKHKFAPILQPLLVLRIFRISKCREGIMGLFDVLPSKFIHFETHFMPLLFRTSSLNSEGLTVFKFIR